ncbi:putative thiol peroxidase [Planctomycetes bacterium Pan216]|uniref:Thiol peroxidase n=1 Tax=Kolteria novifilia TaxID=2527975 RepID=A0A518AXF5_9BACT|nr:putative thiol peroxidase [Planctomycetes bacterium Pan216]
MANVTFKGSPVELVGPTLKAGDKAPDFKLQGADLADVTLATSAGKSRILVVVPSLDTGVCSTETKKFNEEAAKLDGAVVLCVSVDLPFAQKRWCGAEGVDKVATLSDHRDASFGEAYGVRIKGGPLDRVLCRAVFVIGPDDTLKHVEYVSEIAEEPDYAAAVAAAK